MAVCDDMYDFMERDEQQYRRDEDDDYNEEDYYKEYFVKAFENNELYEFVDQVNTKTGVYSQYLHRCRDGVEYIYDPDGIVKVMLDVKSIFRKRRINAITIKKEIKNIKNADFPYRVVDGKYIFVYKELDSELELLFDIPIISSSKLKRCNQ